LINRRKLVKISKTKKPIDSEQNDIKSKYKHSVTDLRNYNELLGYGITKHKNNSKAKLISLDKLHALFSNQCKLPYHVIDTPKQYDDYKWDLDILIEVFEYHIKHAGQYGNKKIRSIGSFIFAEGFNGSKSWSPLIHWHQKMNKSAEGELTAEGKNTFDVSDKYIFVEGGNRTMTYPFGIIDVVSKYIKEKTNNYKYKLVYITKNDFVDEFLSIAKERNILKLKVNGRSVLV